MTLTNDDLLDFDASRLAHYEPAQADRTLEEQGDVFRAQLVAARWLEGWQERLAEDEDSPGNLHSEDYSKGFNQALRDIVAHLRQGDLVPGGILHDETDAGRL